MAEGPSLVLKSVACSRRRPSVALMAVARGGSALIEIAVNQAVLSQALFRTRTGDPLLTMEVLYQLS